MNSARFTQATGFLFLIVCACTTLAFLLIILGNITISGFPELSWSFITNFPKKGMTQGGIFPAIFGTLVVTLIATLLSLPIGVACAVYLTEYAGNHISTRILRAGIRNLAGVPSIVYGLFGLALFVEAMQMGGSILASGCTLSLLTLPYIVTTTDEALKAVTVGVRERAYALGATKWECIRSVVLTGAIPGIMTGAILSLSRAAGETAPVLFTGAVFYTRFLPISPSDEFMALPYHLYILSTQHHAIDQVRPLAYSTALILIILVMLLNLISIKIRQHYRTGQY